MPRLSIAYSVRLSRSKSEEEFWEISKRKHSLKRVSVNAVKGVLYSLLVERWASAIAVACLLQLDVVEHFAGVSERLFGEFDTTK